MNQTAKYYIYAYINPDTMKYFYIGKGSGYRASRHLSDVKNNILPNKKNKHLFYKIKKILDVGNSPIIKKLYYTNDEKKAYEMEKVFIEDCGFENLCNLDYGGKGGLKMTDSQKKRLSEARKGQKMSEGFKEKMRIRMLANNPFKGKTHSKKTINSIKRKLKEYYKHNDGNRTGSKPSEETRLKLSLAKRSIRPYARGINNILSKTVYQHDLNNNMIKEWGSLGEIARAHGYSQSNINECCNHKRKTAHGYKWLYEEAIKCSP